MPLSEQLASLEDEAIWIIRETASAFRAPVLLYSIGKDSTVLLDLCRRAFAPATIPFPVLHIDTTWKFREMIAHRDKVASTTPIDLLVHINEDGVRQGVSPFTHGADEHTRIMKTVALRQALDSHGFDIALGGARRDEERSRAKERVFSLRENNHVWNPSNQRPEFWRSVNNVLVRGQTVRAFPLSNWTELDVWRYINFRDLAVVPLYFADMRPTVERSGKLLVIDDERFQYEAGERVINRTVRFRSLGCYPLTAAVESEARSVPEIIAELEQSRRSERSGRLIDGSGSTSMESKKTEGYF